MFYAGVFASMCGCVEGAVQFLLVEQSKLQLHFLPNDGASLAGMLLFMMIGSLARLAGVSLCYPYQVVRSRMQMSNMTSGGECDSIAEVIGEIWKEDGVAGLYAGLSAKLAREAVYGGVLHGIFETVVGLTSGGAHVRV